MPKRKLVLMLLWLALAISAMSAYLLKPEWFSPENILVLLKQTEGYVLAVYVAASLLRGVFFVPSTPFVLAGSVLFPDLLGWVFLISMAGVVAGGSYIYFFTEYLEVDKLFKTKHADRFEQVKSGMEQHGIWIVMAWSFFPVVPTDLISYAAGVTKMPYWKYALGLVLGEIPLVGFYVFSGKALGAWMLGA